MLDSHQLQQYLESACERGQAWWRRYARFIKEIDDATWFEFGLKVKKVESKRREETDKQENQSKPVLAALNEYSNVPVLVIGSPGAGKSTLLAKALFDRANRALNDSTAPIPVLIELKSYGESGLWGLIQAALEVYDLYIGVAEIKQLVADKRLLLLADGVNELPEEKARLELATFCRKQIPMIFTTRDLGGDLGIEQKLEIQPLRADDVEVFLRDRLPGHDQKRVQELCDRVRDFGQTPLMVWMLYSVFQGTDEMPTTRGEVYRVFTNLYAERAKEGIPLEESRSLMEKLAFEMMHSEKPTELRLEISERDAQKLVGDEKTLNHLLKYHLLERQGHPGNRRIRFCHQSLQEYYAAEALWQKLPDISDYTLKRDYLNYLKWTEAIALLLGLPEITHERAVQIVRLALEADWRLGARLAGEVQPKFQEKTIGIVSALKIPDWLKMELWGEMRSEVLVPGLLKTLENGNCNTIQKAAYVLEKHNYVKAIPALLNAINHPSLDFYASYNVATNTGKLSSGDGIPILLNALKDLDISARLSAVNSLGVDRSDLLVELLPVFLELLQDENLDIRRTIAEALKNATEQESDIRLKTIVPELLQAVNDPDLDVFLAVTGALGNLGSTDAILGLVRALKNPDECVRARAAMGLGNLGSTEAIPDLCQALKEQDALVRDCAAGALDDINRRVVTNSRVQTTPIQELIWEIANPFGASVDERVINILEEVNTFPEAVPYLIKALEDPEKDLRRDAAEVLGKMVSRGMIPNSFKFVEDGLLKLVTDPYSSVRGSVVEALGELRSIKAIPSLLKLLLEDSHAPVRRSVALALGKIGAEEGISELMGFIRDLRCCEDEDESSHLLISAARGLSNFKDDRAAHILPDLLTLIPTSFGEAAFRALTAIQVNCQFYSYEIARSAQDEEDLTLSVRCGEEEYEKILSTLFNMIMVMERNPETFRAIQEEALRDHFLMHLNGIYKGQATGETFNNKGKTDILLRVGGENIFIAECKFWKGSQVLKETFDQLLGYTTWRDAKLAMLIFNRNKNFTAVLQQIPQVIQEHPNFVRKVTIDAETQFRFIVHHPDDRDRELLLTVLAFDIPT